MHVYALSLVAGLAGLVAGGALTAVVWAAALQGLQAPFAWGSLREAHQIIPLLWAADLAPLFGLWGGLAWSGLRMRVAESRRREDALVEALAALRSGPDVFLPDLPDALLLVDRTGRVVRSNRAARTMFGGGASLEGAELVELLPGYTEGGEARWRRSYSGEVLGSSWVVQARGAAGQVFDVELSYVSAEDDLWLYVARDLHEQHLRQREHMTKDLLLAEVRHQALEARRAKSRFLSNMSQELLTPLQAVLGYASMLRQDADQAGHTSYVRDLDRIVAASERLTRLVDNILDLSRLTGGRADVYHEPFDLREVIDGVVDECRPWLEKNGNRIEMAIGEGVGTVHSDVAKVHQTLFHLVENAARFTEGGVVSLTVEQDEDQVFVEVRDTGAGIPAAHRDGVFDAFATGDRTTRRMVGGAGLGLALARGFAQRLGGELELLDEPRTGCAFRLFLPVRPVVGGDAEGVGELLLTDEEEAPAVFQRGEAARPSRARLATPLPPERSAESENRPPVSMPPGQGAEVRVAQEVGPVEGRAGASDPPRAATRPARRRRGRARRGKRATAVEGAAPALGRRVLLVDPAPGEGAGLRQALEARGLRVSAVKDAGPALHLLRVLPMAAVVVRVTDDTADAPWSLIRVLMDDPELFEVPVVVVGEAPSGFCVLGAGRWLLQPVEPMELLALARTRPDDTEAPTALVLLPAGEERETIASILRRAGWTVRSTYDAGEAMALLDEEDVRLVLGDPAQDQAMCGVMCGRGADARVVGLLPPGFQDELRLARWLQAHCVEGELETIEVIAAGSPQGSGATG